jgi:hypothetical protein
LLKVIRHRPLQACVLALLSALVTACAILTALQQRAIDQASAREQLSRASATAEVLQLESSGFLASFYTGGGQPARALTPEELYKEVAGPVRGAFGPPISGQYVGVSTPAGTGPASDGDIAWRSGACAHVELLTGHCPEGARQIVLSTADAQNFGWKVGDAITTFEDQPNDVRERPRRMVLTVTGTYRMPKGTYWDAWTLTGRSGTQPDRNSPVQHDTWLTDRETFDQEPTWRNPTSRADLRLRHSVTGVDELLDLGDRITAIMRAQARRSSLIAVVNVRSELPAVARSVRKAQDQARVTIPALMVPLGVLGLVVLWMALSTAVEQRRPEVAIARLRGRGARGAQAHLVRELLTMVLAGVPLGALAALAISWPARHLLLPGDIPLEIRAPALLALLLSVVLVSTAVVLTTIGVSREPIVALMRRIPARRPGWGLGTIDAVVVTVAASILLSFVTGRLTGPIALVAPAVLAFGAGLVLARLLVPTAVGAGRRLLARGNAGVGVGLLQLARRPGLRATTALLTVAAAILVFAGDAVAVGSRNRAVAAAQRVGAPAVLTVTGGSPVDVRNALSAAKVPQRDVTPVVVQHAVSDDDQTVLYVDADHFGSIGAFPDLTAARRALKSLSPPAVEPIVVTGRELSVAVGTDHFYEGTDHEVGLEVVLLRDDGTVSSVPLGALSTGTTPPRTVTAEVGCDTGCVLTGWKITTTPANPGNGRIELDDLHTDSGEAIPLGPATDWRGVPAGESKLQPVAGTAGTLTVFVDNGGASELVLDHGWVPERLPAVVAGPLPAGSDGNDFGAHGLDGVTRSMTAVARLPWLPAAGPEAAITDLGLAERSGSLLSEDATLQVWLGGTDRDLVDRVRKALTAHGLEVEGVARISAARHELDESAATWSLELGILVGMACLLVAVLGLAIAGAGAWRARSRDLAVLRLNGMSRGDVRRISLVEQLPAMLVAVLLGATSGVVAAHYALPTLPLLAVDPQVDLVDFSAAWGVVVALAAVALAVLGLVGWTTARAVADAAGPSRVTDAP